MRIQLDTGKRVLDLRARAPWPDLPEGPSVPGVGPGDEQKVLAVAGGVPVWLALDPVMVASDATYRWISIPEDLFGGNAYSAPAGLFMAQRGQGHFITPVEWRGSVRLKFMSRKLGGSTYGVSVARNETVLQEWAGLDNTDVEERAIDIDVDAGDLITLRCYGLGSGRSVGLSNIRLCGTLAVLNLPGPAP